MTLLKLLQHIQLPLLLTRRLPHLLLPLIKHHFLHHAPRLPVQIPQLAVLRLYLAGVEEVGGVGGDGSPPLQLVGFVEVDGDFFAGGGGLERPGGFGGADLVGEGSLGMRVGLALVANAKVWSWCRTSSVAAYINERLLALHPNLQLRLGHVYYDVFTA